MPREERLPEFSFRGRARWKSVARPRPVRAQPSPKTVRDPLEADPPIYDFLFEYDSGTVHVKTRSDQIDFGSVSLLSPEKWLFIGYQYLNGPNQVRAEFYGLTVIAR